MTSSGCQALLIPNDVSPLPVGPRHYVPVLQDHLGEREALAHASDLVWEVTTPVVALLGRREPPTGPDSIRSRIGRVARAVGEHPFYLDMIRPAPTALIHTSRGELPYLEIAFEAARRRDLRFIPVAWVDDDRRHFELVARAATLDGRGVALRYRFNARHLPPGKSHREVIGRAIERIGQETSRIDLFLDAGFIPHDEEYLAEDLVPMLSSILDLRALRSVVLLGTSIPATMSCIEEGEVDEIARAEWGAWSEIFMSQLGRVPAFGDYAVQHPDPPALPAGGSSMRRNIRYTTSEATVVARAMGRAAESDDQQYRELCQRLVNRAGFRGRSFSWGDRTIEECAAGSISPGSQEMWRGAGTSHHLEAVTELLRR